MKEITFNRWRGARLGLLATFVLSGVAAFPSKAYAQLIYSGVNNTTLQFPDVFGNPSQPQLFQTGSILSFGAPLQVFDPSTNTATSETNPFNLSIGFASQEEALANGALTILSAAETRSPLGGTFLQQFWQLELLDNPDNVTFQGVFTDSQFGNLANQPNLINAPYPLPGGIDIGGFPFPLATGTQLFGQFSSDLTQVRIQISGNTTDLARPFFADITAAFTGQLQADIAAAVSDTTQVMATEVAASPTSVPETQTMVGFGLALAITGLGRLQKRSRSSEVMSVDREA